MMLILKQNVSTGSELKKKKAREKQRLRKINSKVRIYLELKMILQDANEQLSEEIKNTKLYKESIMKLQSIIQMSIDHKRFISLNEFFQLLLVFTFVLNFIHLAEKNNNKNQVIKLSR